MPVGNVSYYNRRKYSPQVPLDHQSRIFYEDYARPEGASERSRSSGSVSSSAASHQSSSSCVSVNSATSSTSASSASSTAAADAANANVPTLVAPGPTVTPATRPSHGVSGGWVLERDSHGAADSAPGSASPATTDCCVRAPQQVSTAVARGTSVSEGPVGFGKAGALGGAASGAGVGSSGGGGSAGGVSGQQRRGEGQPSCAAGGAGGNNNDQANGPLLLCPPVVAGTSAARTQASRQPAPTTVGCINNSIINNTNNNNHNNNSDEFGLPLSPGTSSTGKYQLGNGNGSELLHQSKPTTSSAPGSSSARQHQQQQQQQSQNPYSKQSPSAPSTSSHSQQSSGAASSSSGLRAEGGNPFATSASLQQQQQQHSYQQSLPPHSGGSVNVNVTVNVVARSVTAGTMTTTTATTTSTTTLAPPRPMQKVIPTVVYLMSRIAVHMEIEGTAQCPAQVMLAAALGCEELGITNKLLAQSVFGLWMTSPLLEVQLKPHHRPYAVRVAWSKLLDKHSHGNELEKLSDEPMTTLRRNVFFSRRDEEKIKDPRILELLYEEARHNVLLGRYVMEPSQSIMLGGIQARIELGPYNSHTHTTSYFRENQFRFLPAHVAKSSSWSWLPISQRSSAEVRLLEQFKRVPTTATTKKLMRKYLEFCWGLPFYGAAYFHGQVEQPVRGLMSLMQQKDLPVLIAVNERGIFVIDQIECTLLLGLKYEEFSWEYAKPSNVNDPECLPCIFLQFGAVENGIAATKLMQIFSRQAAMVDALITHFIEQDKRRKESGADPADQAAGGLADNTYVEPNPIKNNGIGVLSNKFSRLTLATFDDEGRCIGQTGSLSISY